MKEYQQEEIDRLAQWLTGKEAELAQKKITAGFDGFVDTIVRVIKTKETPGDAVLFSQIAEFGEYILAKKGNSFSLETEEKSRKPGGNMPIMANAMGELGIPVNCIGAFGYPQVSHSFAGLSPRCKLYSFADPGTCTAFEFNDGKIMLADMGKLNQLGWETIKKIIHPDQLLALYEEADMFSFVNWSEIDSSTDIWKGIIRDILPALSGKKLRCSFFDLSDCSKRSPSAINEALALLNIFSLYSRTILGLNRNEAGIIHKCLYEGQPGGTLEHTGRAIYEKLRPSVLVLHSSTEAFSFSEEGCFNTRSFFTGTPVLSTGAGDNFNAGFCTAQLLALPPLQALLFANAVSGYYVRHGESPGLSQLISFLKDTGNL